MTGWPKIAEGEQAVFNWFKRTELVTCAPEEPSIRVGKTAIVVQYPSRAFRIQLPVKDFVNFFNGNTVGCDGRYFTMSEKSAEEVYEILLASLLENSK